MADLLGMDPGRIERLRSSDRLTYFDPAKIWQHVIPAAETILADIGAGVGFVSLPFAKAYPEATVYGCDILEGMVGLLKQDLEERGLDNLKPVLMEPAAVPLDDASVDIIVMAQVHHELDDAPALLQECRRLLRGGGQIIIADWKDEENGKSPPKGRRVAASTIISELEAAGFHDAENHDIYEFHNVVIAGG